MSYQALADQRCKQDHREQAHQVVADDKAEVGARNDADHHHFALSAGQKGQRHVQRIGAADLDGQPQP